MRRSWVLIAVGGVSLAFACDTGTDVTGSLPPGVVSATSSGGVNPAPAAPNYSAPITYACNGSQTSCGIGCCAHGYICLLEACVAPGIECANDVDCTEERYCEPVFGRCLPRPKLCDPADAGAFDTRCLDPSCSSEKSALVITGIAKSPCECGAVDNTTSGPLGMRVENRGRKTVPAGAPVKFWSSQDGDAAGDVLTGFTKEPLVPGQSTDVYVPLDVCTWYTALVGQPQDCNLDVTPRMSHTECTASE